MGGKIDRVGEMSYNKFGSRMIVVGYRGTSDIDVYFPDYNWTYKHNTYSNFKKKSIKCPYERNIFGKGYLGEGKYKTKINGKITRCYITWNDMLKRCYNSKHQEKQPTYKGCKVCDDWLNFQHFANWYENNYYEVSGQRMHLDKDILIKGNKIYSPYTCIFVPQEINELLVKRQNCRGEYPIGVSYNKSSNKFKSSCNNVHKKNICLGNFDNHIDAFNEYKRFKELTIKKVADKYKDEIPHELYKILYLYEVEITD